MMREKIKIWFKDWYNTPSIGVKNVKDSNINIRLTTTEGHIGLNAEMGYKPIKKEDVLDAIRDGKRELLIDFIKWQTYSSHIGITAEERADIYLKEK